VNSDKPDISTYLKPANESAVGRRDFSFLALGLSYDFGVKPGMIDKSSALMRKILPVFKQRWCLLRLWLLQLPRSRAAAMANIMVAWTRQRSHRAPGHLDQIGREYKRNKRTAASPPAAGSSAISSAVRRQRGRISSLCAIRSADEDAEND
jgi:hypothetical protein